MKNIFLFLVFIGIFSSCSNDDDSQISPKIIGKWIWIESSGGIAGSAETPEATGNQITIEFSRENYRKYINGVLDVEMSYKIEKGKSIRKTEDTDVIIYENEWKQSFELIDNELMLYDECYDCFQYEYIKE